MNKKTTAKKTNARGCVRLGSHWGPTVGSAPQTMSAPKPASYGKDEAAGYRMAGGYAVGHARRTPAKTG